jgi:hypothetical protein
MANFVCVRKCFWNGLFEKGQKLEDVPEEKVAEILNFGHFERTDMPPKAKLEPEAEKKTTEPEKKTK